MKKFTDNKKSSSFSFSWKTCQEYILITIGLLLYCFAWKGFLLPHQITGGGITGVSAILYYSTGFPVGYSYLLMNILLLTASVFTLGLTFSLRSIYGVLVLALFLSVIPEAPLGMFVSATDGFMACVIGGIIWGVGYGMMFLGHGSSGGTFIIAAIINKYSSITIGRALLYCDVFIICSSYFFVSCNLEKVIYGLVTMAVATYVVDLVISGVRQSVQFFIFSKEYKRIADRINGEIGRGVTVIDGVGWYSKEPVKMISVIARKDESSRIFGYIKEIDPDAFVSQSSVIGVYGRGFDVMKN